MPCMHAIRYPTAHGDYEPGEQQAIGYPTAHGDYEPGEQQFVDLYHGAARSFHFFLWSAHRSGSYDQQHEL